MDKMSLFSILTVSVPEAILSLYFGFLITGEKTHLYLTDRINVIRLFIAVSLMVFTSVLYRAFLPNLVVILFFNVITYIIIFKYVYQIKLYKSLITVVIALGFLMSVEMLCTPLLMYVTKWTLKEILTNDYYRLVFNIIERLIQIFVIISLWNWNRVLVQLKNYKEVRAAFAIFMLLLLLVEIVFFAAFVNIFPSLSAALKLLYSLGGFIFCIINFYFFKFISILTNAVLKQELEDNLEYKREIKSNYASIYYYLEKGDIESARKVCRNSLVMGYQDINGR